MSELISEENNESQKNKSFIEVKSKSKSPIFRHSTKSKNATLLNKTNTLMDQNMLPPID